MLISTSELTPKPRQYLGRKSCLAIITHTRRHMKFYNRLIRYRVKHSTLLQSVVHLAGVHIG